MSAPAADPARSKLTRSEWGLLAVLAATNCTQITDALLVAPLAVPLQEKFGVGPFEFSVIAAVYGFAAAVAGLFSSAVIDRFDRRRVVLLAFAGLLGSILFTALAPTFPLIVTARVCAGIFGGLTTCATLAVVGEAIPESRRGTALGILNAAFGVAAVIGLPLCILAKDVVSDLWASFAAVAAFGSAVWVWGLLRLPRMAEYTGGVRRHPLREFVAVVTQPAHARAFAFMLCVSLGTYTVIPFLAQYCQQNVGVSEDLFKYIFLAMGLCSLVVLLVVGKLTDRIGRRPVFLGTMLASMAVTLVFTHLPAVSAWLAGVVACAYMAAAVGRLVPTHAMIQDSAIAAMRGGFTTAYNSVSHLATSIGPLIAGLIVTEEVKGGAIGNYPTAGYVAVGFAALGIVLSFWVRRAPAAEPAVA